ncbi:MAG: BPSS1780 family membrane protein [Burkholderiales bacterium]
MTTNPYAAPKAAVADDTVVVSADFIPGGQSRDAGRGWAWIAAAWDLFKRQPGLWIGIWVLMMVIFIAAAFIPFIGSVFTILFWPVFMAGIAVGCRELDQGRELELAHLFAGFRERIGPLIGVGALYFGMVVIITLVVMLVFGAGMFALFSGGGNPDAMAAVGVATAILAVLVMLALMLPVVMAIWFAPTLVVLNDFGPFDAMKASFFGCLRNILPFLVYGLVGFGLAILAMIPLFLGWLVLGPVVMVSLYTAYRDIYFKPRA